MSKTKKSTLTAVVALAVVLLAAGTILLVSQAVRTQVQSSLETLLAHTYPTPKDSFPNVSQTTLTDVQKEIVRLSKQEYQKKPVSFDSNVLKYSQGYKEPWCANFASWIMKNAGVPFSNPNSGSWRIPGVSTLQEYFQQEDRYQIAGSYQPQVGDVAIFKQNRSHANIVIAANGSKMTTVGGNENGHVRINTQAYTHGAQGLSGFGMLAR